MPNVLWNALRDEARDNLRLISAVVVSQAGAAINVGENFTVRLTIKNTFAGGDGEHPGHAHFTNVKLRVAATQFATPIDGNPFTYDLTDHLGFGNTVTKDVTFRAIAKKPIVLVPIFDSNGRPIGFRMVDPIETIAGITISGKFDVIKFFEIAQEEMVAEQVS